MASFIQTQTDFLDGAKFVPFQNINHEDNRCWGISSTTVRELSHDKQTSVEARLASDADQRLRYVAGIFYYDDPNEVPRFDVNQQANAAFQQYTTKTIGRAAFANLTFAVTPEFRVTGGVRDTKDQKSFDGTFEAKTIIYTQPGYSLWDFDLTYATAQSRFYVGAYVDNAFNKTALSFSFGTPFSAFMTGTLQAPRVFGIRTGVHF